MLRIILVLFLIFPEIGFPEVTNNGRGSRVQRRRRANQPTAAQLKAECERKFRDNNCQAKVEADPDNPGNYLNCEGNDVSPGGYAFSCLSGAAQGVVDLVRGVVMMPYDIATGIREAFKNSEECFNDHEKKREIASVIRPLYHPWPAEEGNPNPWFEAQIRTQTCENIYSWVFQKIRTEEGAISIRRGKQRDYENYIESGQGRLTQEALRNRAERLFPRGNREVTAGQEEFLRRLTVLRESQKTTTDLYNVLKGVYFCASNRWLLETSCRGVSAAVGGTAGAIALARVMAGGSASAVRAHVNALRTEAGDLNDSIGSAADNRTPTTTGPRQNLPRTPSWLRPVGRNGINLGTGPLSQQFATLSQRFPNVEMNHGRIDLLTPGIPRADSLEDIFANWRGDNSQRFASMADPAKRAARIAALPPDIRNTLLGVFNRLSHRQEMGDYLEELYKETTVYMARRGNGMDLELLERGEISTNAMQAILHRRLRMRGEGGNMTVFSPTGTRLSPRNSIVGDGTTNHITEGHVNDRLRQSFRTPFIDHGVADAGREDHGALTHLIQRDMISQVVNTQMRGNPQGFWDFLGTRQGVAWWNELFDQMPDADSFHEPETIQRVIRHSMMQDPWHVD